MSYLKTGGFDFVNFYVDTHFATRGRQGRLARLIYDTNGDNKVYFGVGVDENSALVVENGVGRAMGENGVYVVDIS